MWLKWKVCSTTDDLGTAYRLQKYHSTMDQYNDTGNKPSPQLAGSPVDRPRSTAPTTVKGWRC